MFLGEEIYKGHLSLSNEKGDIRMIKVNAMGDNCPIPDN